MQLRIPRGAWLVKWLALLDPSLRIGSSIPTADAVRFDIALSINRHTHLVHWVGLFQTLSWSGPRHMTWPVMGFMSPTVLVHITLV